MYLDLDFRADQWHDLRAYGVAVRAALPLVDVAIGTEEEIKAAGLAEPEAVEIVESQITAPNVQGELDEASAALLGGGPQALVVKRGERGARVHLAAGELVEVAGFAVEVLNVLGAGDAFASGLIYGRLQGWDWYKSTRLGNACGAIVVTRAGVANFMPYEQEALDFVESNGGF